MSAIHDKTLLVHIKYCSKKASQQLGDSPNPEKIP